ncbi:glutathione S-transferase N-terminal domain-containing protein [Siccirubricoccus deserti]
MARRIAAGNARGRKHLESREARMILIGQYDSPFVRRIAIAMRLYDLPYKHLPWSTFGDADRLAAHNPLRRVPTLILDDGDALIDSVAILDHLDEVVGPERALMPVAGPARRAMLRSPSWRPACAIRW